jgi:hypothetical protein
MFFAHTTRNNIQSDSNTIHRVCTPKALGSSWKLRNFEPQQVENHRRTKANDGYNHMQN